ncbi:MAG: hypothetical protein CL610_04095 [Anaerolineaceae bacterium]|nr:hypothetical protein [Anaerolineaceae bacterium]
MIYETFLFTRNQKRDFTAFVRPRELTNKEVSLLASALGNINDVANLTRDWPAFYSLPVGQYNMLLRHYDSGRKHAGRPISVVEGIAVRRTLQRHYTLAVPHFLAHHDDVLHISRQIADIEAANIEESAEHDWPDVQAEDVQSAADDDLINAFLSRLDEDRLFVPFTQDGRALLISALTDPRLRKAHFAFGTNADVLARLHQADIQVDIVSYFNTTVPSLRNRQTNEITSELTDFIGKLPARPEGRVAIETDPDYPTEVLPTPRQVRAAWQRIQTDDDPLAEFDAGDEAMLTMREMRRGERQQQAEQTADDEPEETRGWLLRLIARLLGKS